MNHSEQMEALRRECGPCQRCALADTRTNLVFGDGNPDSGIMLIGEGPGEQEDLMGVPLLLPRRERVQRELSGWFGDKFEQVEVAATYNLILNAANMIRNGVGVALGVLIGNLTNELKFIPLSPPMETGSVLVWKKDQTFSPASAEFLSFLRYTE